MPRNSWVIAIVLLLTVALVGCGMKSEADVVEDLSVKSKEGDSYRTHATMYIQSGQQKQEYDVEVWYQAPHYYRVALNNKAQDVSQIILRNDEGVFVLTPKDNKHFRFQSNWPDAHGQPYLYQTLVQSIVEDDSRKFETTEDSYVFDVAANYKQNQALKRQQIQLNKNYEPQRMSLLDADGETLVEVTFDKFESKVKFDSDAFDMERNMEDWGEETATTMSNLETQDHASNDDQVGVLTPNWLPEGTELVSEHKVAGLNGEGTMFKYGGEKPFTLLQQPVSNAVPAMAGSVGEPVHLDFTVAVLLEQGDQKQLNWSYDGKDFQLRGALTNEELTKIAESLYGQSEK